MEAGRPAPTCRTRSAASAPPEADSTRGQNSSCRAVVPRTSAEQSPRRSSDKYRFTGGNNCRKIVNGRSGSSADAAVVALLLLRRPLRRPGSFEALVGDGVAAL